MIHLQMRGLIGNNLFQYAFARIVAEELGYELKIVHSAYKPKDNVPQLVALMSHFRDAALSLPGASYERPVDKTAFLGHEGFDGYHADLEGMIGNKQQRRIMIDGFFERYELFRNHKERIRSWFEIDPVDLGHDVSDDDVVMHVRRGDFIVFGRAISLSYYLEVLEQLDFRRLYVCGFGIDDEVQQSLRRYGATYVHGTPVDDFRFMMGFRRIIQSQSTFVWWSGFLSQADEIYAPVPSADSTRFERRFPHIDLRVDDEERYRYVDDVAPLERSLSVNDVLGAWDQLSVRDRSHALAKALGHSVIGGIRKVIAGAR